MALVNTRLITGLLAVAIPSVVLLIGACGGGSDARDSPSGSPLRSAGAAQLFRANCAVCHGPNGEGQPDWHIRRPDGRLPAPPLNGDGHTWHHGDGTLYRIVSQGGAIFETPDLPKYKSGMPAFGGKLSHEETIAVVNYLKTLWEDKAAPGLGLTVTESQAIVSETDPFPDPVR